MLNGLDLFSGIGGLTLALADWVEPVLYCENDRYAQAVLLSRMVNGSLPTAPIWDDVRTLRKEHLPSIDLVYGGFPCQDISVAGSGKGLGGERSGLFFEIVRLVGDLRPRFVFLENVPAISVRGLDRVLLEFASMGYDCRWSTVSAAEVGAPHLRERWFLLATDAERFKLRNEFRRRSGANREGPTFPRDDGAEANVADPNSVDRREGREELAVRKRVHESRGSGGDVAYADDEAESQQAGPEETEAGDRPLASSGMGNTDGFFEIEVDDIQRWANPCTAGRGWWSVEPDVGRVAHGVPLRVDRLKGLGNAVVPTQAREAFERLMGL